MAYTFIVEGEDVCAIREVISQHKAYLVPSCQFQYQFSDVYRNRLSYEIELPHEEMVKFNKSLRRLGRGKVRFSIVELIDNIAAAPKVDPMVV